MVTTISILYIILLFLIFKIIYIIVVICFILHFQNYFSLIFQLLFLGFLLTESGLPGVLFNMLDTEMDKQLIKDIHDTLISMLQMLAVNNLTKWINLCKSVLTVSSGIEIFQLRLSL